MLSVLIAALEQQLHSEADAEQRLSVSGEPTQHTVKPSRAQLVCCIAERPDPRQDYSVRRLENAAVSADRHALTDRPQRTLERKQIANTVIDYRDHHSTPLVDGISPAYAGSRLTA